MCPLRRAPSLREKETGFEIKVYVIRTKQIEKKEGKKEQVEDREKLIYQQKMKGLQQLLEKQTNYVESLEGMRVTVMGNLSNKGFHQAVTLFPTKSFYCGF